MQDEALNAITGLSARPGQYPWQAHARGLVAHVVYGLVTDIALNAMDAVSHSVSNTSQRSHLRHQTGRKVGRASYDEEFSLRRDAEEMRKFADEREFADATAVQ